MESKRYEYESIFFSSAWYHTSEISDEDALGRTIGVNARQAWAT